MLDPGQVSRAAAARAAVREPPGPAAPRHRSRLVPLAALGPAVVVSVAYVDPGNVATNTVAGAQYGYLLLWVLVAANVLAMLVQYLSAKLGLATGRDLAAACRDRYRPWVVRGLWVQAELVVMATDLAEFVGAAIALHLLFGTPPLLAGAVTALVSLAVLALQSRGRRRFELFVGGLLGVVLLGFVGTAVLAGPDAAEVAKGLLPGFEGSGSALLAAGIVGATVMPHVIYLHSALTAEAAVGADSHLRHRLLAGYRVDIVVALGLAGIINAAMLVLAAAALHGGGADSIEAVHAGVGAALGGAAAVAFALALLAAGLSSSAVGTYAGAVVMQGFVRRTPPLILRRVVTMAPALGVLALGTDASTALVVSQVVLCFGVPFALVPLLLLTRDPALMGSYANRRRTTAVAGAAATLVILLDVALIGLLVTA